MKLALAFLASWLSSCAVGSHADIELADGSTVRLGTSNSVLAKQENVVASAEATLPSGLKIVLKQSVKKQDAENVGLMGLGVVSTLGLSGDATAAAINTSNNATKEVLTKSNNATAVELGAQAAGLEATKSTVLNPNVIPK